jgi:protein involved in polysaccharide export with SLBB domain
VTGVEVATAEALVREAGIRRGVYRNPQISIRVEDRRINRVTVLGAVEEPGVYEIPASHSDLLAALVAAGGPRDDAATVVEIRHPPAVSTNGQPGHPVHQASYWGTPAANAGSRFVRVDLMSADSAATEDLRVFDGTVVMVQQRAPQTIYVMGLVKKADQYELPPDEDTRLLDAIALAGGRTLEIADRVRITRKLPHLEQPISIEASIKEAERDGSANIRLAAGDMVHVKETPATFTIEMLRSFIRFGFSSAIPGF